jgi:Tfp pilus assembly protein PilP
LPTPPTTSVVIDLDRPLAYELTPGPAGKVILTLHSQGAPLTVAKNTANSEAPKTAPSTAKVSTPMMKSAAPAAKPVVVASAKPVSAAAAKPVLVASAKPAVIAAAKPVTTATAKPAAAPRVVLAKVPVSKSVVAASKPEPIQQAKAAPPVKIAAPTPKIAAAPAPKLDAPSATGPTKAEAAPKTPKEEKKWAMNGKRDPFFSPVVQQNGSGCSTGKKCLDIGAINLRGVVKSDTGFIAVVTNSLNKAYFLRENDPVFNGYVVKITGDSVVFQETIQDKLGKSFTREVVKRIFTPAV